MITKADKNVWVDGISSCEKENILIRVIFAENLYRKDIFVIGKWFEKWPFISLESDDFVFRRFVLVEENALQIFRWRESAL